MMAATAKKFSLNKAFRLISILLVVLIAIELICVLSTSYSLFNQYRSVSIHSMLQIYSQSIDSRLQNVDNYMNTLISNSNVKLMGVPANVEMQFSARNSVSGLLSTLLQLEPMVSGALCWVGDTQVAVSAANDMVTNENIRAAIFRFAEEQADMVNTGWSWARLEGQWYLVNLRSYQSCWAAAWIGEDILDSYTQTGSLEASYSLFCRQDGWPVGVPSSGLPAQSVGNILSQPSKAGAFEYCCLALDANGSAFHMWITILVCCPVIVITVFAIVSILSRIVKHTFGEIQEGMAIKGRDLAHPLANSGHILETDDVFKTLDDMSDRILNLQNDVYLHALNEKNARLQALHMQINSHFFANCMNVIFSLAEVRNTPLIQDFCIYLNDYFRYINTAFRSSSALRDELKHLQNYLSIQQMRYPERVRWDVDVQKEAEGFRILPLILLTFIENIFKHAMTEAAIDIRIVANCVTYDDGQEGLSIRIEDNGAGIKPAAADPLNAFDFSKEPAFDGKSGIEKTLARIQIYYGRRAAFHIGRNGQGVGTVVTLFLPNVSPKGQ